MPVSFISTLFILSFFLEGELIFPPNEFHNHGSTIIETETGDLLAAWFHGSGERWADDVVIQGARKRKGASEWSAPFLMADTPDLPDCNPVLFLDSRGVLWLFWITVQDNQWGSSLLKYRTSTNYAGEGAPKWEWQDVIHVRPMELEERFLEVIETGVATYGDIISNFIPDMKEKIEDITARAKDKLHRRLGWMTRTPPTVRSDGSIMLGLYSDVFNCSLAAFTNDAGERWSFSTPIMDPDVAMLGNIQPCFAQRKNGEIIAFMRDNGIPKQVRWSMSQDNGLTWGPVLITGIPNPGSSVDVQVLRSGKWALVCNDTMLGRHQLSVYLSDDEGLTWERSRIIEEAAFGEGSFSYPTVIQSRDDAIHVTYSYKRKEISGSAIKHVRFTEEWIIGKD
ncbi:MAG TPA: neuraminidase (sialidase)-like protein [Candidatus Hydrogenedentes bacterium]|nr:neuraminidase (sialidase)-like protein [Candidatus Hydrogenedentota bacterium]